MDLPLINKIQLSKLESNTRILIKEFRSASFATFKCYNSAMLLFRPLLIHFAFDYANENDIEIEKINSFSNAIDFLDSNIDFTIEYFDKLTNIKNVVNKINHNMLVLNIEDIKIIEEAWDFIKWMVEEILNQ